MAATIEATRVVTKAVGPMREIGLGGARAIACDVIDHVHEPLVDADHLAAAFAAWRPGL